MYDRPPHLEARLGVLGGDAARNHVAGQRRREARVKVDRRESVRLLAVQAPDLGNARERYAHRHLGDSGWIWGGWGIGS